MYQVTGRDGYYSISFHNIISHIGRDQFAFVPRVGQSSVAALTYFMHRILSFLDSPGAVRMLIDYTKAFDRIPHQIILKSLAFFNAPNELIHWMTSYLQSRMQCVKVNGLCSKWFDSTSGVPQGGILSPLLLCFVINELQPRFANSCVVKFADE